MGTLEATIHDLKMLLRNSLRVGDDIEITDTFPLANGPIDLDSIDILLIISNIERHFSMKIPNEAINPEMFQTIQTLAAYIEQNRDALADKSREIAAEAEILTTASPGEDVSEAFLARLPHGPEFRFVSSVRELLAGDEARGTWVIKGDEAFLAGHFPGRPLVPGVLIAEALAQISGLAAGGVSETALLSKVDISFLSPVVPPADIELRAKVVNGSSSNGDKGSVRRCQAVASVKGVAVAEGNIALKFMREI